MLECKKCDYNCDGQICKLSNKQIPIVGCEAGKEKIATNYFNIQNMTIDGMANFIVDIMEHIVKEACHQLSEKYPGIENTEFDKKGSYENIINWLQQEA